MTQTKQVDTGWLFHFYAALVGVLPWSPDVAVGRWHIQLPSEALTCWLGFYLLWFVWHNPALLRVINFRPVVVWASLAWLLWLVISMLCSTMPLVSFKYGLVEAGNWLVFFIGFLLFPGWWQRLLPIFIYSMGGVVIYTLAHHSQYDFRADQSMLAPLPFFPDHTLYSAILVMLLPVLPFLFKKQMAAFLGLLFLTGLVFASCRAAWLSLLAGGLLIAPLVFRQKLKWWLLAASLLLLAGITVKDKIQEKIHRDVSALERMNRYTAALHMASERPFMGFGPGTYQFQYLPFQQAEQMTRISITDPQKDLRPDQFGRGGGGHSEYFQALSENGWPGLVFWLCLAGMTLFTGISCFLYSQNTDNRWFILAVTGSLLTFFIHALFNNFLHDGRLAMLFWGQITWLARRGNRRW